VGRVLAEASEEEQQRLLRSQMLLHVPLVRRLQEALEASPKAEVEGDFVLDLLSEQFTQPEAEATDAQRGDGTWGASIEALRLLNRLGYGQGDPNRQLTLMSNPAGTQLQQLTACDQRRWAERLQELAGVQFDRLIGLNNMPIARFLQQLQGDGHVNCYLALLERAFNPAALEGLMCRDTLSVAPNGQLYDCDFNQMLELPLANGTSIATISGAQLLGGAIRWGNHCYGCTAGQGSSCSGATTA
jgi:radical SAM/Cys-rich protein